ncbi:MAG TPA: ABC transporter permease [Gemmatimonadaceae bacterium]|nr:ABC transporter permease [Gemmatimonadaceae bacterium]
MHSLSRLTRRLRLLVARRRFERDLDDELRFHMEMSHAVHLARGASVEHARALTHKEFGSMDRFKDEVRDARGLSFTDDLARDVRFALRALRRTPGFTAIALLTFALGIGANTAIFSIVNAVLLRPLPYANAGRVVRMYETLGGAKERGSVSVPNWRDWQQQLRSFESVGGFLTSRAIVDGDGSAEPMRVRLTYVTTNVPSILGAHPLIGRLFQSDEQARGRNHVVLLSEGFWRSRFAGSSAIIGQTLRLEGEPYTVIGVMPSAFNFPDGARTTDLWSVFIPPERAEDPRARGWHWIQVLGLLKPGVTVDQADMELKQVAARLEQQYPTQQTGRSAIALSMQEDIVGDVRPMLVVLLGAVFLVLLIACANVANLLLARNATRQKDVGVRLALGASRGQITRQFLTESIVLALVGAVLGLGVARGMLGALAAVGAEWLPVSGSIPIDWHVLAALIAMALLCGLAFGLAPALQVSPKRMQGSLQGMSIRTTASGEMRRFRSGLVVAQIALSLMLLVGAGLLMRAFVALQSTDAGLDPDRVLTAKIAVPRRFTADGTEATALLRPFLDRIRAIPGVKAAGMTSMTPIEETGLQASFWIDRRAWPEPGNEPNVEVRSVSPGFLPALGVRFTRGRDLVESDDSTSIAKAVVNEALVRRLLPGEDPIGRHLLQGNAERHFDFEIVGVVADMKQSGLDVPAMPEIYTSYNDPRIDWTGGDMSLVVKTAVPEVTIVSQVRSALREVARDVALTNVRPMREVIERSLSQRRLTLFLFGVFAAVALALAASGLYGVIYYIVTQRTREIGIRVALGADTMRVIRLVLGHSALLAGLGIGAGLVGALLLSRLLTGLLYGVTPHDTVTFVSVPVVLALVALLAALVPTRRATHVDPVIALRSE